MTEAELLDSLLAIRDNCFDMQTVGEINTLILERWGKK
jgi:hypothetical protein